MTPSSSFLRAIRESPLRGTGFSRGLYEPRPLGEVARLAVTERDFVATAGDEPPPYGTTHRRSGEDFHRCHICTNGNDEIWMAMDEGHKKDGIV